MHACRHTDQLQWFLPILIFAGLIFVLFSFCAKYTKIRPPRKKKGFTVHLHLLVQLLCFSLEFFGDYKNYIFFLKLRVLWIWYQCCHFFHTVARMRTFSLATSRVQWPIKRSWQTTAVWLKSQFTPVVCVYSCVSSYIVSLITHWSEFFTSLPNLWT